MVRHERYSIGRAKDTIRASAFSLQEKVRKTLAPDISMQQNTQAARGEALMPDYGAILSQAGLENPSIINQKEQTIVIHAERPDGQKVIIRDDFFGTSVTAFKGDGVSSPADESTFWDGRADMARFAVLTALTSGIHPDSPLNPVLNLIEELKEKRLGFDEFMSSPKEADIEALLRLGPDYVTLFEVVYAIEGSAYTAREQREDLQRRLLEERKKITDDQISLSYRRVNIVGPLRRSRLELGLHLIKLSEEKNAPEILKNIIKGMGEIEAIGPASFKVVDYVESLTTGTSRPLVYSIDEHNVLSSPIEMTPRPFPASDFPTVTVW